ncbi:hypothetical protein Y032_0129g1498 [Ancylostoma ceylanicum]|uniref:Uncharacterized protein n=1 Tax=Ancylostoma ceylanicum TaxID=53326 RepID=A0A016T7R6_9BILA|nr:hypothetical protein Y032_0129g1498 [Ancylostoma ceylanicum]
MSVSPLLLFVLFAYSCCQSNPGPGAPGPRNNWGGLGLQNGPPVPVTGQTSGGAGNNPWQSSNIPGPSNNWGGPGQVCKSVVRCQLQVEIVGAVHLGIKADTLLTGGGDTGTRTGGTPGTETTGIQLV